MTRHRHVILGLALLVAVTLAAAPASAAADGFVLICNAKATTRALSRADVRSLYTGKAKTLAGAAVVVVIKAEDDVPFTRFADQIFGVPTRTLLSKIKQEVFKGEMTKPVKATSDDEVIQNVSASTGTIGIVSVEGARHLPSTVNAIAIGG